MASPYRPPARRGGASGAWNRSWDRLKPMAQDALDEYQLPSKGEKRLHDYDKQERYYAKIVERYMKFCSAQDNADELEKAFASVSLRDTPTYTVPGRPSTAADSAGRMSTSSRSSGTEKASDLPHILMAMRKLREGILGSRRTDGFAQRAYMFIIRASIMARHWESYQPALLYLLYNIHPRSPLSSPDLQDFVGYHMLDLVCRQDEPAEALAVMHRFRQQERKSVGLIRAVLRNDWVHFWRLHRVIDGYQRAIAEFAEDRIRAHALKCLGRSYMQADRAFVERSAHLKWPALVKSGVGWQLREDDVVVIRKPKPK